MNHSSTTQGVRTLVITNADGDISEHKVVEGRSVFLGSSPDSGIHVDASDVAEMHCLVSLDEGLLYIQNWASSAGTIVDGEEVEGRYEVSESNKITVGSVSISLKPVPGSRVEEESTCENAETETDPSEPVECLLDGIQENLEAIDETVDTTDQVDEDTSNVVDDFSDDMANEAPVLVEPVFVEPLKVEPVPIEPLNGEPVSSKPVAAKPTVPQPPTVDSGWGSFVASDCDEADSETMYDQETVDLLRAEIEDLRTMLADNDCCDEPNIVSPDVPTTHADESNLQQRVDELLLEAEEHDEKIEILSDLLESAEHKDHAELEERQALEAWVGEIEQRIGQRETEWQAELDSLKQQLESAQQERDETQREMREVAARFNAPEVYQETLDRLQTRNAELEAECEAARSQTANLKRQIDEIGHKESDEICETRALLAQERAEVSRLQFELASKLSEIESLPEPETTEDREFAMKLRSLRVELRAISEVQRREREEKGESLISRISGIWKRADEF